MRAGALWLLIGGLCTATQASAILFDSSLRLKVYVRREGQADRVIGFTPTKLHHRITRPEGVSWYVQPVGPLSGVTLQKLGEMLREKHVPGLDLSDHWELSDARFEHLGRQPQLRYLNLSRTPLASAAVHQIGRWHALTTLLLNENTTDASFAALQSLEHLRELSLDRTRITDKAFLTLLQFKKLEKLDLSGTAITNEGLIVLSQLPALKTLVLNGSIDDGAARSLAKLSTLKEIDFSETQIGEEALKALASLPHLEIVFVNKSLTDKGLERLAKSESLQSLDLTGSAVTDRGLSALAHLKTLDSLALTDTAISDEGIGSLAKLHNLKILELSNTRVTSQGIVQLMGDPALNTLSFSWERLSRDDVVNLSKLSHIQTIFLNGIPLSNDIMSQLRDLASVPVEGQTSAQKQAALGKSVAVTAPPAIAMAAPGTRAHSSIEVAMAGVNPSISAGANPALAPVGVKRNSLGVTPNFRPSATSFPADAANLAPMAAPTNTVAPKSDMLSVTKLNAKTRRHGIGSQDSTAGSEMGLVTNGPQTVQAPAAQQEDQILKAIALHAKEVGRSPVPSLAGLKVRSSFTGISDVSAAEDPAIKMREDKPENKLPDINVGAGR